MKFKWLIFLTTFALAAGGYFYKFGIPASIQKHFEPPPIPDSAITFPLDFNQFAKTELFLLVKDVMSHDDTAAFLFKGEKFPVTGAGKITQLHPRTFEFYERCMSLVASDPQWTETYNFMIGHEILGLNPRLTNVSGEVDSQSEKLGRDFVYQIADNNMKYLMEGIDKEGAAIMMEILPLPSSKPELSEKVQAAYTEVFSGKPGGAISKQDAGYLLSVICGNVDVRLGLLGLGTNYQNRVASVAEIVRKRILQAKSEKTEKRRERLNKAIDVLTQ